VSHSAISAALATAVGHDDPCGIHLVQVGSARATGSVTLHAWVEGERRARWVAKAERDVRYSEESLRREWTAVRTLRQESADLRALIPAARARFTCAGTEYFVYDGAAGRTMYAHFRNRILRPRRWLLQRFAMQALGACVRLHQSSTRPALASEVADDFRRDLAWLEQNMPGLPVPVVEYARAMLERTLRGRARLPVGHIHGDFSPYNLLTARLGVAHGASVRVIDWEHAEPNRPQYLDVFRFVAACALMGLRGRARDAVIPCLPRRDPVLQRRLLHPWFDAMTEPGAAHWLDPARLEALWAHFLVHAARREAERSDSPLASAHSTYVTALAACAGRAGSARGTRAPSAGGAADAWTRTDAYRPR
jgi:hypothetical protein